MRRQRWAKGLSRLLAYLSFHINKHGEMNIFGNPNDPACVALGVYSQRGIQLKKFQELARQFLAGYLSSRQEIGVLYQLNLKGDKKRLGRFVYRIIPPESPESHGGWWISISDPERLDQARVSSKKYEKMTLPAHEIKTRDGRVRHHLMSKKGHFLNQSMLRWVRKIPGFQGFYRNGDNELKVAPSQSRP